MNNNKGLFSKIIAFLAFRPDGSGDVGGYDSRDNGIYGSSSRGVPRDFDGDYRSATAMLREQFSKSFPDNFHARVGTEANSARDYGDERAGAIDTASAAIAAALRSGATAKQAAAAGAPASGSEVRVSQGQQSTSGLPLQPSRCPIAVALGLYLSLLNIVARLVSQLIAINCHR